MHKYLCNLYLNVIHKNLVIMIEIAKESFIGPNQKKSEILVK